MKVISNKDIEMQSKGILLIYLCICLIMHPFKMSLGNTKNIRDVEIVSSNIKLGLIYVHIFMLRYYA